MTDWQTDIHTKNLVSNIGYEFLSIISGWSLIAAPCPVLQDVVKLTGRNLKKLEPYSTDSLWEYSSSLWPLYIWTCKRYLGGCKQPELALSADGKLKSKLSGISIGSALFNRANLSTFLKATACNKQQRYTKRGFVRCATSGHFQSSADILVIFL